MGYHEPQCNADHRRPVGCDVCSCEAGREIKRLREALRKLTAEIATNPVLMDNISSAVFEDALRAEARAVNQPL